MQAQIATPSGRLSLIFKLKFELLYDALQRRLKITPQELDRLLSDLKDIMEKGKTLQ